MAVVGRAQVRVVFRKPFGPPRRAAYSLPLVTQRQWESATDRENLWRIDIKQDADEPHTDGVGLTYQYGTSDTYLCNCSPIIEADEQAEIDRAVSSFNAELSTLAAKAHPTADDLKRVKELQGRIVELTQTAFWQDIRNPFGDGANGVYRSLSAPNVPCRIRTDARLDEDRPFTVWFYRAKPDEAQEDATLRLSFGGKWRLEFGQGGGAKLYKLRPMKDADRKALEDELKAIDDSGKLTRTDKTQIKAWRDAADLVVANAKKAGRRKKTDLTAQEQFQLTDYKARTVALRASKKGLTGSARARRKAILDLVFEESTEVTLYEDSHGLLNRTFAVTFLPQPRGYLTIANSFSANYWNYQDKAITDKREFGVLLESAPLEVSCNGGSFWWKWAYPAIDREGFIEGEGNLGADMTDVVFICNGDWSAMPGTTVLYGVQGIDQARGKFRWRLALGSDGRYMPFVYTQILEAPASVRNIAAETVLFDTQTAPGVLADATAQFDLDLRGRKYAIALNNEGGALDWLAEVSEGLQVEVWEGERQVFTGVLRGRSEEILAAGQSVLHFEAYDRWELLREDIAWTEIAGDGKRLDAHLREVLAGRGFAAWEVVTVATPSLLLPRAAVGEEPKCKASVGEFRGQYVRDLAERHAVGLEVYFDEQGRFVLARKGADIAQINFVLRHANNSGFDTEYIVSNPRPSVDYADYYNWVQILGAEKPGHGSVRERYAAVYADYGSVTNPASPNYLGYWKALRPQPDDSLNTQALVNRALRQLVTAKKVIREVAFDTTLDPGFRIGLRCRYDGTPVEISGVSPTERKTGRANVTVRYL